MDGYCQYFSTTIRLGKEKERWEREREGGVRVALSIGCREQRRHRWYLLIRTW